MGDTGLKISFIAKLWVAALISAGSGFALKYILPAGHPFMGGLVIVGVFAVIYFPATALLGIEESKQVFARVRKMK